MYKLLCIALFCTTSVLAQKTDKALQDELYQLTKDYHGTIGIYVQDLKHNRIASINADSIFPTASIVKIPILTGIMQKIESGQLDYHQRITYTDSLFYNEGDDILSNFKPGSTIELSKVMMLMITISDNCASLWLQGLAGGGTRINQILDSIGFKDTRVNSRTPGREANRSQYGWGQSTPREMASFMQRIVQGNILTQASSEKMLRILSRQYWDEEALSQVPPGVFTAAKSGAVDASRTEVLYVNNAANPYIFSIFTKNNTDKSWEYNNEAWVLTRKLSALLWKHFNPKSTWQGPAVSQ